MNGKVQEILGNLCFSEHIFYRNLSLGAPERLSEGKCTRQSREAIWDMINTLFLAPQLSNLLLLLSILSSVYSIKTDLAEMAETTLKIGGCTYPELQKRSVKPRLYWLRDQFHETQTEVPLFCLMKQAETLFWPECVLSHRCYRKDASVGTVSFLFLIAWQKISFQDRQLIKTLINLFAADTLTQYNFLFVLIIYVHDFRHANIE